MNETTPAASRAEVLPGPMLAARLRKIAEDVSEFHPALRTAFLYNAAHRLGLTAGPSYLPNRELAEQLRAIANDLNLALGGFTPDGIRAFLLEAAHRLEVPRAE